MNLCGLVLHTGTIVSVSAASHLTNCTTAPRIYGTNIYVARGPFWSNNIVLDGYRGFIISILNDWCPEIKSKYSKVFNKRGVLIMCR